MDEIEHRVAALELLYLEESAWRSRQRLEDIATSLRLSLERAIDADQRAIRAQALALIEDALEHHPG